MKVYNMSGFNELKYASNAFENEIRYLSESLFCAKIGESFDENIAKKSRDLALFTSKLRFLRAKHLALNHQVVEHETDVIRDYGDTVSSKVFEQLFVKSTLQTQAVKALLTTPDSKLDQELIEKKQQIRLQLKQYADREGQLRHMQTAMESKERELWVLRCQWDSELGGLRDMRDTQAEERMPDFAEPMYKKLCMLVTKMELMRWLTAKLVTARSPHYDWLDDPHRRLQVLMESRHPCTVDAYLPD